MLIKTVIDVFLNSTNNIQALEASCPTDNFSNMKFLKFSLFGDNVG
jgi:hypothetical protein